MIRKLTMRVHLLNPAGEIVTSHGCTVDNVTDFCDRLRKGILAGVIAAAPDGVSGTVIPVHNVLKIEFTRDESATPKRELQP